MEVRRFGLIMSVVATARIPRGEEVLVSYNYNLADCPAWYSAAWFTHLREGLQWSEVRSYSVSVLVLLSAPCPRTAWRPGVTSCTAARAPWCRCRPPPPPARGISS